MRQLLEIAKKASLEAGKRIIEIYQHDDFGIESKDDESPLTEADLVSHQIIMNCLKDTGIPVLSEEGKGIPYEERKKWNQLWIIDPLDGTQEFIKRNGEFTVNIALVENRVPVLGVIYAPAQKLLYYASTEVGSFKAANITADDYTEAVEKPANKLPLTLQKDTYTVVASKSHLSPETEDYIASLKNRYGEVTCISVGSSLKFCMVAEGQADCYPRFGPTMEWDTAAGQAISTNAGKKVYDYSVNEEMLYNRKQLVNNWFLVK